LDSYGPIDVQGCTDLEPLPRPDTSSPAIIARGLGSLNIIRHLMASRLLSVIVYEASPDHRRFYGPKATTFVRLFRHNAERKYMRRRPLIAPPIAMSLLPVLTGCHQSRVLSPALPMATVALSAGGLLGAHLLIALRADRSKSLKKAEESGIAERLRTQVVANNRGLPKAIGSR
jgi:hypothetical protein